MKRSRKCNSVPATVNGPYPLSYSRLIFVFLASICASYIFYALFYHYSSLIWSFGQSQRVPLAEYTPWVQWCVPDNDGIELYVLYPMIFAVAIAALSFNKIFNNLSSDSFGRKLLLSVAAVAAIFYFRNIRFNPPMAEVGNGSGYVLFMLSIFLAIAVLSWLLKQNKRITNLAITLLLIPACFISTENIFLIDYGYIFSPALRIAKGISPGEIYFQYDYLLSMLAALWIKLTLPLLKFKFMGQLSYFVLFLGIYFLASRLFSRKLYALYLFIALIIVKIYGIKNDPVFLLQVSPLRLDLWFIPLALVYYRGPSHWSVGLALALLVALHYSFGLIYTLSYTLFISVLFFFEIAESKGDIRKRIGRYLSLYGKNAAVILIAIFAHKFFFEARISNVAFYYRNSGLGFLPVSKESFYWYVPLILSATLLLLVKNRKSLADKYFKTGIFLLILAIGNSLYFFGRSHEHNIINISAVLLFVLFLCLDLVDFELARNAVSRMSRYIMPGISVFLVLLFAHYYSGRAVERIAANMRLL